MKLLASLCFVLVLVAAGTADAGKKKRFSQSKPAPAIPEPTAALLFGAGVAATMALTRRARAR